MKPPVTYYGGKQKMVDELLALVPRHKVYNEPFFGGGTLFFAKKPVYNETINDRLGVVVNFYRQLQSNFNALNELIQSSLISRDLHSKAHKLIKNKRSNKLERAWAFWYASNFGYASKLDGGLKFSNDQDTVVPRVLKRKKAEWTMHLKKRIENAHIENRDALWVIKSRDHEDCFHYLDPPYMNADQGHYRGYSEEEFEDLLDICINMKGKFLLSNFRSDILYDYQASWNWNYKEIKYNHPGMRSGSMGKVEVLVWNYDIGQAKLF